MISNRSKLLLIIAIFNKSVTASNLAPAQITTFPPQVLQAPSLPPTNISFTSTGMVNPNPVTLAPAQQPLIEMDPISIIRHSLGNFVDNGSVRNVTFSFEREEVCGKVNDLEVFIATLKRAAEEIENEMVKQSDPTEAVDYDPTWKISDLLNCPNACALIANFEYEKFKLGDPAHVPDVLIKEFEILKNRIHIGSLQIDRDKSLIDCTKKLASLITGQDESITCTNDMCNATNLEALEAKIFEEPSCKVYYMKTQLDTMFSTLKTFNTIPKYELVLMLKGILARSIPIIETIERDSVASWENDKVAARAKLDAMIKTHNATVV